MNQKASNLSRIPVSVSLEDDIIANDFSVNPATDKKRLLFISALAVGIGMIISVLAKLLVLLINLITNISFHQQFSLAATSPATNSYGLMVVIVPVAGGVIIGLMALYGSRAIRGHGIPEAMEQILTNKSRIRPSITYLKPLSSAISIGTGGPFGAEGPIIATGGALGSTIGQLLRISHYERKILLAAGATAGMSAIFGSPIAAVFLAIELLLFEFSPASIVPVAFACITGAAGHHLLFEGGYVFAMPALNSSSNTGLAFYSTIGIIIGFLAAFVTKFVYLLEDAFEKLPVHWMWWPAIGGIVVGLVGYVAPRTLGVGYDNISDILSGKLTITVIIALCLLKFISWAVALGSGTSGGTLAPLLTIGGASGFLLGVAINFIYPAANVSLPMAGLIGMSAMFAGASRALLTSIMFAIETTGQTNALLPLLAACIASYFISLLFMKNTIMTEKIARRGIHTPSSYKPDILDKILVESRVTGLGVVLDHGKSIAEIRDWVNSTRPLHHHFIVADKDGIFKGVISLADLSDIRYDAGQSVGTLIRSKPIAIAKGNTLKSAVELMAKERVEVLPVISVEDNGIIGLLSYKDIISAYGHSTGEHERNVSISLKRRAMKMLVRGKKKWKLKKIEE